MTLKTSRFTVISLGSSGLRFYVLIEFTSPNSSVAKIFHLQQIRLFWSCDVQHPHILGHLPKPVEIHRFHRWHWCGPMVWLSTGWDPSSESLSWCVYNSNFTMVFVGDISIVNGLITHLQLGWGTTLYRFILSVNNSSQMYIYIYIPSEQP